MCRTSGIAVGVGLAACEVWESFLHNKDLGTDKGKETWFGKSGPLPKKKEKKVHAFHVMSVRLDDHKTIIIIENT